jgi:hypothetical protein
MDTAACAQANAAADTPQSSTYKTAESMAATQWEIRGLQCCWAMWLAVLSIQQQGSAATVSNTLHCICQAGC